MLVVIPKLLLIYSQMYSNIIPFFPLQHTVMDKLFDQKLRTINQDLRNKHLLQGLHIPDSTRWHFLHPDSIEYMSFKVTSGDDFVFSKYGGHELDNSILIQLIKSRVVAILSSVQKKNGHVLIHYHRDSGKLIMTICDNEAKTLDVCQNEQRYELH